MNLLLVKDGLSVEDSELITIKNLAHAKDYWNALKEVHEKENLVNKVCLYTKLWKCHLGNKNTDKHINEILQYVDELKALVEDVKD
uniref:Uncharacterized protein n=1 Tax=Megaselia scalaris TaxID=36166 RepID=T1GTN6_MEGSC